MVQRLPRSPQLASQRPSHGTDWPSALTSLSISEKWQKVNGARARRPFGISKSAIETHEWKSSRAATAIYSRVCWYNRDQVKQSPLFLENLARKEASQAQAVASGQQAHEQVPTSYFGCQRYHFNAWRASITDTASVASCTAG